jgi:type VI secretion system secreted protein VgrG
MTDVRVAWDGVPSDCRVVVASAREGLGMGIDVAVDVAFASAPTDLDLLGRPAALVIDAQHGQRVLAGRVTRITRVMTAQAGRGRRYRLEIRSSTHLLSLRRRTFVWQHLSVPEVVARVVLAAGYESSDVIVDVKEPHEPRAYVTQYDENDEAFVRRLCEDDGLYFRFDVREGREIFVLEDTSGAAPAGAPDVIQVSARTGAWAPHLIAVDCREVRRRRPGGVRVRDYDPLKPSLALEQSVQMGCSGEQGAEVYAAPGGFRTPEGGRHRAELLLQSMRASASTLTFQTNAITIAPGTQIDLRCARDYEGTARPEGQYFVTAVRHEYAWSTADTQHVLTVEAIPLDVPYRLPRTTKRPVAQGVHTTVVTGEDGHDIHPDEHGRVFVRFPWDREGPADHRSSLPVRTMQPNAPGSMLIPRVGWEVWVMFEDGDPDRPYVIGRTYNAKQPPPVSLPANKTMTSLATHSSPGGKGRNAITFDDGAGRQHLAIAAAFDKGLNVAGNAMIQTAKVDNATVVGSLTRTVAGSEDVSVGEALVVSVASQSASVGGSQKVYVKGSYTSRVATETILVGGALIEQVGNPADGAVNLAKAAALQGVGSRGAVGAALAAGAGLGMAGVEGYKHGGAKGAASAVGMGAVGMAAGMVPGGEAILASVQNAAAPAPWKEKQEKPGSQEAGGGAGGAATDSSAAAGAGAGHRDHVVKGAYTELIGGVHGIVTPGSIGWKVTGPTTFLVGGSHSTKTAKAVHSTTGASKELLGSLQVTSGAEIARIVTGGFTANVGGALKSQAGGGFNLKVNGDLKLKVGGSLDLTGATVTFVCGSSKIAASSDGLLIEASTVTVSKTSKQSSKATHK